LAVILVIQQIDFGAPEPEITAWDGEATRIEIAKPNESLTLRKQNGAWVVTEEDYPASKTKVENMVSQLRDIGRIEVVSTRENYGQYELEEASALHVTVYAGDTKLRELYLGKDSDVGRKSYARQPGEARVFLVDRSLKGAVDTSVGSIRDKNIVEIAEDSVSEVALSNPEGATVTLVPRQDDGESSETDDTASEGDESGAGESASDGEQDQIQWTVRGDVSEIESQRVNRLFSSLARLQASSFDTESPEDRAPVGTINVARKNGTEFRLTVYPAEKEEAFAATASTVSYPFVLGRSTVERLFLALEAFLGGS
jgi:hypothetical protein